MPSKFIFFYYVIHAHVTAKKVGELHFMNPENIQHFLCQQIKKYANRPHLKVQNKNAKSIISVTELLQSPYLTALEKKYGLKSKMPVENNIASFTGTAAHGLLEQLILQTEEGKQFFVLERRHETELSNCILSGAIDLMTCDGNSIVDFKFAEPKPYHESIHELQLNLYRFLVWRNENTIANFLGNIFFNVKKVILLPRKVLDLETIQALVEEKFETIQRIIKELDTDPEQFILNFPDSDKGLLQWYKVPMPDEMHNLLNQKRHLKIYPNLARHNTQ